MGEWGSVVVSRDARPRAIPPGIESPWKVARVELRRADGEVHIFLEHDEQVRWPCRQCSAVCALHDHQPGRWRHLDTCQYRTILHARVEAVAMDMWDPYVASTREHLDESEKKIVYDKYHIAAHLAKAVDQVRRAENKRLLALGDERLTGTKYAWLRHPANFSEDAWREFARKRLENGAGVGVEGNGDAAVRSSRIGGASFLRAMARLGESQPADADGHRSADVDGSPRKHTHVSETPHYERGQRGVELKDSMGKATARGFRNQQNFINAIYFHCGKLDLAPSPT